MSNKRYPLVFIVEDNIAFSRVVEHHLKINNYENVMIFTSGEECLKNLYQKPDIIIQDYKLQGISGISVLQRAKKVLQHTEFIFLSAQESIDIAVNTLQLGAFDYIVKNEVALHRLLQKIESIVNIQQLKKRNRIQKILIVLFVVLSIILLGMLIVRAYA